MLKRSPESRVQGPESRVQGPESRVQSPESRVQSPESRVQSPESRVQSPESRVQSPESRVQSPESRVQSPESRVQSPVSSVQSPESSPALILWHGYSSTCLKLCFNLFLFMFCNFQLATFYSYNIIKNRLNSFISRYCSIHYNAIKLYCENTLSYNNGVHLQTGPKLGSVKARQLIYRYSTNTKNQKLKS